MTQPYPTSPNDPNQPQPPPIHEPGPQPIHPPLPDEPIHPPIPEYEPREPPAPADRAHHSDDALDDEELDPRMKSVRSGTATLARAGRSLGDE